MDRAAFYASLRRRDSGVFGTSLTQGQVDGCEAILAEGERRGTPRNELAYLLATPYHETGGKMLPNAENLTYTSAARIRAVWPSRFPSLESAKPFVRNPRGLANKVYNGRLGNRPGSDDGYAFRGRGLPHLTGRANYAKASAAIGVDLVAEPERALELPIAVKVLFDGLGQGWFTGRGLPDFIDANDEADGEDGREFAGARRTVNGSDQALRIAGYALSFEAALTVAGYPVAPRRPAPTPVPAELPKLRQNPPLAEPGFLAALLAALVALFKPKG